MHPNGLRRTLHVGVVIFVAAVQLGCGNSDDGRVSTSPLSWQDQYDGGTIDGPPGHPRTYDEASDLAVCDGRVFVAGVSTMDGRDA
jgi:hypothetical protein